MVVCPSGAIRTVFRYCFGAAGDSAFAKRDTNVLFNQLKLALSY